jgi:hypothetical protein
MNAWLVFAAFDYIATPSATGLSSLAVQHLAGAVMWLIGAVPFALIGVAVLRDEG